MPRSGTSARTAADDARARLVPLDILFCELRKGAPLTDCLITRDGLHPLAEIHENIAGAIVKAWKMEK